MAQTLCDECRQEPATVFVTKIVDNHASKVRLCEACARRRADGQGFIEQFTSAMEGSESIPLSDVVLNIFQQAEEVFENSSSEFELKYGEFPSDEDGVDELEEEADEDSHQSLVEDELGGLAASLSQSFDEAPAPRSIAAQRCPKCSTTWDRLKQDGRVGCAACYEVFRVQLGDVMGRVQQSAQHHGKHPRAAEKRKRRLEQLRERRDHRLDMLNQRLRVAVTAENYEEAARLRDKIKIVTSTIVSYRA